MPVRDFRDISQFARPRYMWFVWGISQLLVGRCARFKWPPLLLPADEQHFSSRELRPVQKSRHLRHFCFAILLRRYVSWVFIVKAWAVFVGHLSYLRSYLKSTIRDSRNMRVFVFLTSTERVTGYFSHWSVYNSCTTPLTRGIFCKTFGHIFKRYPYILYKSVGREHCSVEEMFHTQL